MGEETWSGAATILIRSLGTDLTFLECGSKGRRWEMPRRPQKPWKLSLREMLHTICLGNQRKNRDIKKNYPELRNKAKEGLCVLSKPVSQPEVARIADRPSDWQALTGPGPAERTWWPWSWASCSTTSPSTSRRCACPDICLPLSKSAFLWGRWPHPVCRTLGPLAFSPRLSSDTLCVVWHCYLVPEWLLKAFLFPISS